MEKFVYHEGFKVRKEKIIGAVKSLVGLTEDEIEVVYMDLKRHLKRRNREITRDVELTSDEISRLLDYYSRFKEYD